MTSPDGQTSPRSQGVENARHALRTLGLTPMTWDQVMHAAELRFDAEAMAALRRHHRSFTGYPTESTLKRFYGWCYGHRLHDVLGNYRFERLALILTELDSLLPAGARVLEIGAGGGHVLHWLLAHKKPQRLAAWDLVPEAAALWPGTVTAPEPGETFDYVLALDALGELHAEDAGHDLLETLAEPQLGERIEQAYGFAEKLKPWRRHVAAHGQVVVMEPMADARIWSALGDWLSTQAWTIHHGRLASGQPYLRLSH